jgi:protein TonB
MFEDSLFASRVGTVSADRRWTWAASLALQATIATVVIVVPMFHPEVLQIRREVPKVLMPLMPKAPVRVETRQVESSNSSAAMPAVTQIATGRPLLLILHPDSDGPPPAGPVGLGMAATDTLPIGVGVGVGHDPVVSVRPETKAGPLHVSTGVSEGMLLAPIRPVYPSIARAARVEGAVVVEAIISKTGTIESLRVVSGPVMLQSAAVDAIREARYRPYRLNGEAVEVETRITVNFRIGG